MPLDVSKIKKLNEQAKQLNSKREQMIGAINQALAEFESLVARYKEQYGVELNPSNIQQEYNTLSASLQEAEAALESQIQAVSAPSGGASSGNGVISGTSFAPNFASTPAPAPAHAPAPTPAKETPFQPEINNPWSASNGFFPSVSLNDN